MTDHAITGAQIAAGQPGLTVASWLPRRRELVAIVLLVGFTAWAANALAERTGGFEYIWPANAILLAIVATLPTRQWAACLAIGLGASILAKWIVTQSAWLAVALPLTDSLEIYLAAWTLRRQVGVPTKLGGRSVIGWFFLLAVVVAPAVSANVGAIISTVLTGVPYTRIFDVRFLAHALGMAIFFGPVLVIRLGIVRLRFERTRFADAALVFGSIALVSLLVFGQSRYPLLFLIFPALVWAAFRFRYLGVIGGLVLVTVIGIGATVFDHGPLALVADADDVERIFLLQFFLITANAATLPVAIILEELKGSEERFRFLSENASDLVLRVGLDGMCRYISPSAAEITGWPAEDLLGAPVFNRVQSDDAATLGAVLAAIRQGDKSYGNPFAVTFRGQHKDGHFIWLEAHIRRVDDQATGRPLELVVTARDITQRREAEERLAAANRRLEELARNDGLTGIANRRNFDETLAREWLRSSRDRQPLALLMLDIDQFKLLNDFYGHAAGDQALQRIARIVGGAQRRQGGDFAARYGGEEFVVLLPNTPLAGALVVADAIRAGIAGLGIENALSQRKFVTVSVGVAAMVARPGLEPARLVEAADRALYEAKHKGRNRVEAAAADADDPGMAALQKSSPADPGKG